MVLMYANTGSGASPVVTMPGSARVTHIHELLLAIAGRKDDATKRAVVAWCLTAAGLTQVQAARVENTGRGYVVILENLTQEARLQVARGDLSLAKIWRDRYGRRPVPVADMSNAALDELVAEMPERVMAALERYTAPIFPSVAAE